jgi:protein kinase-like protein
VIEGRYAVLDEAGRGAKGIVWLAEDRASGRRVAIRELPDGGSPEERARVVRDARAVGQLRDPGVVAVHDVLQEDGKTYVVLELIEAPSLSAVVTGKGPLPEDVVALLAEQLLSTLDAAHAAGLVHRDVKPGNVLMLPDDRVKLADFGIARSTGDARSDLRALGEVLFYAVEGRSPLERPVLTRCHGPLASVIAGLLDATPDTRPTAAEARAQLDGTATSGTGDRSRRDTAGTKLAWRVGSAVVVAAIVAGAILLWNADRNVVGGTARPPAGAAPPAPSETRPRSDGDLRREILDRCAPDDVNLDTRKPGPLVRYDTGSSWVVAPTEDGTLVFDCTKDDAGVSALTLHDVPPPNDEAVQWISRSQLGDHEIYFGRVSPKVARLVATHPDFHLTTKAELANGLYAYDWPSEGALNVTLTAYDKHGAKVFEGNCCLK